MSAQDKKAMTNKCSSADIPRVPPPPATIDCTHCGCVVEPNTRCHCGTISTWAMDPYDGWYAIGTRPSYIIDESLRRTECPYCKANLDAIEDRGIHNCPIATAASGGHTKITHISTKQGIVEIHQLVNEIISDGD